MLILNRRFRLPFAFASLLVLVPRAAIGARDIIDVRPIALLAAPGIADNFEGLAVEQRDGRTFIWLLSDDNFVPSQRTYLLKLEWLPPASRRPPSPARASDASPSG